MTRRVLVVTVSDGVDAGVRTDTSGEQLRDRLVSLGYQVDRQLVADEAERIRDVLDAAAGSYALVLTTGGTGLTPRDVTPQATAGIVDYEVPGMAEAMRAAGRAITPLADLSRGVVGVRAGTLIVNLPGSPKGALESLAALEPLLDHALETLAGPFDHSAGAEGAS